MSGRDGTTDLPQAVTGGWCAAHGDTPDAGCRDCRRAWPAPAASAAEPATDVPNGTRGFPANVRRCRVCGASLAPLERGSYRPADDAWAHMGCVDERGYDLATLAPRAPGDGGATPNSGPASSTLTRAPGDGGEDVAQRPEDIECAWTTCSWPSCDCPRVVTPALLDRLAAAEARAAQAEHSLRVVVESDQAWATWYAAEHGRAERLAAALRKYGRHTMHCTLWMDNPEPEKSRACSCGFAALAGEAAP